MKTIYRNLSLRFFVMLFGFAFLVAGCSSFGAGGADPDMLTIAQATETPAQPAVVQDEPTPTAPQPTEEPAEEAPADLAETDAAVEAENSEAATEEAATEEPAATAIPDAPTEAAPAVQVPPLDSLEIELLPVVSGLNKPLYVTHAGDGSGRLFIVEQDGTIQLLKDGAIQPAPFLDIVSIVGSDANEQGLLSVAFHPDYANNGFFFIDYTDNQGDTVIARYSVSDNPDMAEPASAKILLTIDQPYANHNGGQLAFGPDGYLYIGMGDGGAANDPQNRAQQLDTLLGKILRIDVDNDDPYAVPETNPFVADAQAQPEIWSYGWRNPWRFSFDQATNDMYIADVGQNQYEEVNVELAETPGGQNYGWRLMEGFHCHIPDTCDPEALGLVLPVTEYDHSFGCSITGGYVYRGGEYAELTGTYFYGDFCSGIIWGLRREPDGTWSEAQLLQSSARISSFGQDEAGEVYLVDQQGEIFRLAP